MPTRQVESTHEAEQDHPIQDPNASGVESPSADSPTQPEAATAQPRRSSPDNARAEAGQMTGANGLPPDTNQDDAPNSDQDIDTAGTEADEQSPTRNLFLALTPSLQRG